MESCATVAGRKNVTQALKAFRSHYETHSHVHNAAMMLVPEERREKFHEVALQPQCGKPAKASCQEHSQTAATAWEAALTSRKRAFQPLGSNEVMAYKKRRTADRTRVAKKFFLDNQLPRPEVNDSAENDAGLPAACSSDRAAFKRSGASSAPEGFATDPAAGYTAHCRVPQPGEIPRLLRKLSLKLSKVPRPLDIDVGPDRRALNGYRHHVKMIRFSWSEQSVTSKIAKARCMRIPRR